MFNIYLISWAFALKNTLKGLGTTKVRMNLEASNESLGGLGQVSIDHKII
jgi:hypothetical protein